MDKFQESTRMDFFKLKTSAKVQSEGLVDEYDNDVEENFDIDYVGEQGYPEHPGILPVAPEHKESSIPMPKDDEEWLVLINEIGKVNGHMTFAREGKTLLVTALEPIYPNYYDFGRPPPTAPGQPLMVHPEPKKLGKERLNRKILGFPKEEFIAPYDWDELPWTTKWGRFMLHLMKSGFKIHRWMASHPLMAKEMEWKDRNLVKECIIGQEHVKLIAKEDGYESYKKIIKKDKYWFARSDRQRFAFVFEDKDYLMDIGITVLDVKINPL